MAKREHDVIVVGAGAAGLACAQGLHDRGADFLLLEAQSRVGGRVYSYREPVAEVPLEFGAEFIHSSVASTFNYLRDFHIPFYDVKDDHFFMKKGQLALVEDYWGKLGKITDRLGQIKGGDKTIKAFLEGASFGDQTRALFVSYVEGFHSANLAKIGAQALSISEQTDENDLNGAQLFRPLGAYDAIFEGVLKKLNYAAFRGQTAVREVEWKRGHVTLHCEEGPSKNKVTYHCKKVVVTIPVGVLKSSAIKWNPYPEDLRKTLSHIEMGHIQKISFCFKERFWEGIHKKPLAFLHADPSHYFPTWWTLQPLRTKTLVAWQGGPKALEMSQWPLKRRVKAAIETLSHLLQKSTGFLNGAVTSLHTHDWSADRFCRGAYSYVSVNGVKGASRLARPFSDTIFFAGEGTVLGADRGTVNGALDSGRAAAKRILS